MRLKIVFHEDDPKKSPYHEDVGWYNDLMDFPKLIDFRGSNYSWGSYDQLKNSYYDYELHFFKVPEYDRDYWTVARDLNDIRDYWKKNDCECGAEKLFGPKTGHSFWCPKWKKMT